MYASAQVQRDTHPSNTIIGPFAFWVVTLETWGLKIRFIFYYYTCILESDSLPSI